MQTPLQITFHGAPRSEALEARIREKAARLEKFYPRITSCRVAVEERDRHRHQGKEFRIRLDVRVPEHEIVVNRDHHEDVYVALRDAFHAAARQLEDVAREQRGDVKFHAIPQHGRVARLFPEEGYAFIETAEGTEFYFSRDNVVHPGFSGLEIDDAVQFIEEPAGGGQAKRVSAGKHQP